MSKLYEITQVNPAGNGTSTTRVLVENPSFEGTGIRATKVGEWDGKYAYDENGLLIFIYSRVEPADFMVVGNATCVERMGDPFKDDTSKSVIK